MTGTTVTVHLDPEVAADVLALLTAIAEWGDDWALIAHRSIEAIEALRAVLPIDLARDAYSATADGAEKVAATQ